jgi:hypothetical protein
MYVQEDNKPSHISAAAQLEEPQQSQEGRKVPGATKEKARSPRRAARGRRYINDSRGGTKEKKKKSRIKRPKLKES